MHPKQPDAAYRRQPAALLASIILILVTAIGCRATNDTAEQEPAVATVELKSIHQQALPLAGATTVQLGNEGDRLQRGRSHFRFKGLPAGSYPIKVLGELLAEPATLQVDEHGAGSATVLVAPLYPPPQPDRYSTDVPEQKLRVDLTNPKRFQLIWKQGATTTAITETAPKPAAIAQHIAPQWKMRGSHQDSRDARRDHATIIVDDKVPLATIREVAEALLAQTRDKKTTKGKPHRISVFSVTVALPAKRPPPPEPHRYASAEAPPKGTKPRVRLAAASISGRLSPDAVKQVIADQQQDIERCYWGALHNNTKLTGRVSLRFVIGADGMLTNVQASGDTTDRELEACITQAVRRLTFPRPKGGIVTVSLPILVTP